MDNAKKPSATHLENVDYPYHRGLLSCDFEDNIEYKKAYAKIMQYATRKGKLLLLDFEGIGVGEYDQNLRPHDFLGGK